MKTIKQASYCVLALFLLVATAHAAVSIESFTCNGMSGTVVVENGETFSCQASIKNEDTQNSANIGSISLLVNGNWAETTSYTGAGFSTTLGAGASTTATFSGIKGVAPGATNKFQSVQIDSSSDTFVTNTNVNVVVIKTLAVTTSTSSVAQGSEFDVSATMIAGGDLGSVTLTWSGSGGCAVSSGHTAAKDVGALSHNAETTRQWRIIQGSSNCINTITASGTSSSVTITKLKTATVFVTSSSSSSSSTTTSGSGGGGGGSTTQTKTIGEIKAGESTSVDFTKTVTNIFIEVLNNVKNVVISVEEVSSPGVPSLDNVYKYIEIKTTNLSANDIRSAEITFTVNKTWLLDKDKNTVKLNRYNNNWSELVTSLISEDTSFVNYRAKTPGFSVFAITAKPAQPSGAPAPGPDDGSTTTPTGTGTNETPSAETPNQPSRGGNYSTIILLIVLLVVATLGWLYFHGPMKKKFAYDYAARK